MANTVSFNISATVDTVKSMNSYRRMIANGCYKVISIYNDYPISTWTGSKRKQLHEKLFGTDNTSGYVGEIIKMCVGDGAVLNELLYNYATYIIKVVQADGNRTVNLTTDDFVNDSIQVTSAELAVTYESIDEGAISTPGDSFENFKASILSAIQTGISTNLENFATNLNRLPQSVADESVREISRQVSILNEKAQEFESNIRLLLDDIANFGTETKESLEQTVTANEQVTSNMNSTSSREFNPGTDGSLNGAI